MPIKDKFIVEMPFTMKNAHLMVFAILRKKDGLKYRQKYIDLE